jgi:hypothetical protein
MQAGLKSRLRQASRQVAQVADAADDLFGVGLAGRTFHRCFRRNSMSAWSALEPRHRFMATKSRAVTTGNELRRYGPAQLRPIEGANDPVKLKIQGHPLSSLESIESRCNPAVETAAR